MSQWNIIQYEYHLIAHWHILMAFCDCCFKTGYHCLVYPWPQGPPALASEC